MKHGFVPMRSVRLLCAALIFCLCLPLGVSCAWGRTETVYLNTSIYVYNDQNRLLEAKLYTYNEYGQILSVETDTRRNLYTYDEQGNQLTERIETVQGGTVIAVSEIRRSYDENGNAVTEERYSVQGETESLLGSTRSEYDASGRLIRTEGTDTVTVYEYGEFDSYTATETLLRDGTVVSKVTVVKNADGNILSRRAEQLLDLTVEEYEATYREDGLIATVTNRVDGIELDSYRYEYEEIDGTIRLTRTVTLRNGIETELMLYRYDEHGNRTHANLCTPAGVAKRTYIYNFEEMKIKLY